MELATKPLCTGPKQFVLTSQMTLSGKGIPNRTCGILCSATYTGQHTNSLCNQPSFTTNIKGKHRVDLHLTFTNMACVLSMFLCQPQYLVHNMVTVMFITFWGSKVMLLCLANVSWLLMHNDLNEVFGQIKIQMVSSENWGALFEISLC